MIRPFPLTAWIATSVLSATALPQDGLPTQPRNLDFEAPANETSALPGWLEADVAPPPPGEGYLAERDTRSPHGGKACARLERVPGSDARFGTLGQTVPCGPWRGERLRFDGWLRTEDVDVGAGLWMRIDGQDTIFAFDNMSTRFVRDDSDWTHAEVVLDVDPAASRIAFGVLLLGGGSVWVDDLAFEVVDESVASTALLSRPSIDDTPPPQALLDWMTRRASPIGSLAADAPKKDLSRLGPMIGDARLVALGEPVRASHEVIELHRRVLEYLVEERGFDTIALDSGVAETLYLGLYVTRGRGDARALATEVLPWHRQNEEVLGLVEWMHDWNTTHDHKLKLVGVESLGVQAGVRSVTAFLERVDAGFAQSFEQAFVPLASLEEERALPPSSADLDRARALCERLLDAFRDLGDDWSEATSSRTTERAQRLVIVLAQVLAMASDPARAEEVHTEALLDNVTWLLGQDDQAHVVLLTHDRHLARGGERTSLGDLLRQRFGNGAVSIGTTVRSGSFRTWGRGGAIEAFELDAPPVSSLEAALPILDAPALLIDLRAAPPTGPVRTWLDTPHLTRLVDDFYLPKSPDLFLAPLVPTRAYDLWLHVEQITPDRRLEDS